MHHPTCYGQPNRRICWLVQPTSVDMYLPEDHTLEYWICTAYSQGMRYPQPMLRTLDRDEASRFSVALYMTRQPHVIQTKWRDPSGLIVKKLPLVKRWKEQHERCEDES